MLLFAIQCQALRFMQLKNSQYVSQNQSSLKLGPLTDTQHFSVVVHNRVLYFKNQKYYTLYQSSSDILVHLTEVNRGTVGFLEKRMPVDVFHLGKKWDGKDEKKGFGKRGGPIKAKDIDKKWKPGGFDNDKETDREPRKWNNENEDIDKSKKTKIPEIKDNEQHMRRWKSKSEFDPDKKWPMRGSDPSEVRKWGQRANTNNEDKLSPKIDDLEKPFDRLGENQGTDLSNDESDSTSTIITAKKKKRKHHKERSEVSSDNDRYSSPQRTFEKQHHIVESDSSMEEENSILSKDARITEVDGKFFQLKMGTGVCVTYFANKFIYAPCTSSNDAQKFILVRSEDLQNTKEKGLLNSDTLKQPPYENTNLAYPYDENLLREPLVSSHGINKPFDMEFESSFNKQLNGPLNNHNNRPYHDKTYKLKPYLTDSSPEKPYQDKPYQRRPYLQDNFFEQSYGDKPYQRKPYLEDSPREPSYRELPSQRKPFLEDTTSENSYGAKQYPLKPYLEDTSLEYPYLNKHQAQKNTPYINKPREDPIILEDTSQTDSYPPSSYKNNPSFEPPTHPPYGKPQDIPKKAAIRPYDNEYNWNLTSNNILPINKEQRYPTNQTPVNTQYNDPYSDIQNNNEYQTHLKKERNEYNEDPYDDNINEFENIPNNGYRQKSNQLSYPQQNSISKKQSYNTPFTNLNSNPQDFENDHPSDIQEKSKPFEKDQFNEKNRNINKKSQEYINKDHPKNEHFDFKQYDKDNPYNFESKLKPQNKGEPKEDKHITIHKAVEIPYKPIKTITKTNTLTEKEIMEPQIIEQTIANLETPQPVVMTVTQTVTQSPEISYKESVPEEHDKVETVQAVVEVPVKKKKKKNIFKEMYPDPKSVYNSTKGVLDTEDDNFFENLEKSFSLGNLHFRDI